MSDGPVVLGIETSCDETGLGVVAGTELRANVLASQVDLHARFGGVVPEVAARAHVESVRHLAHRALAEAGVHQADLGGVAATQGPGLVGALVVGFTFAKSLAWALGKPFIGVNHMEGHLFAPLLGDPEFAPPAVVLLVSGGHSQVVHMRDWGDYEILGSTIDDAAGEALDKTARFLGLGYPGGPAIDRLASEGDPGAVDFPRALADRPYDFSFSGLKTSLMTFVRTNHEAGTLPPLADVAASLQEAIVDVLVAKTFNAVEATGVEIVGGGGGVMANSRLRRRLQEEANRRGVRLFVPPQELCTDNGAMIAVVGSHKLARGEITNLNADVDAGLKL
ncbi:MAG: tRNA (adenosine(37)-N6)-threonylcarbamoyltransferase complex transferase subunit TsaD [Acidimicrobiia bacterium]|nr:tRNA (adenosine(37)-N6)-threonylcarbamoyltransferase complex transferase subunit TsaD [Acidimicrobiia bacterium]